jgi:secreted trypsin-like serine protease
LNLAGAAFTISGFGLYSDKSDYTSANLLFVTVPVITNTVCARTFGPQYVRDSNVCTDGAGGRGSCGGDSGGPGTVFLNGRAVQVGVVSYGAAAGCELGYPDVFTRVGFYLVRQMTSFAVTSFNFTLHVFRIGFHRRLASPSTNLNKIKTQSKSP